MSRFVDDEEAWLKGPYVQVGLPFVPGTKGRAFFANFETQYPGHDTRSAPGSASPAQHKGLSTLVATGTGSGKTECFLYPVLDHCARARGGGEAGIKALVIYPMNALATDQARRIAELVASIPAFAGLRVGLYVGGAAGPPGQGMVMTPTSVITDRDTMRKNPPDILLTNYKMLDYLMLRPKDRQLWASNAPTTLRYVVVDELHTFDGAQGTDLALLLRRLRARLKHRHRSPDLRWHLGDAGQRVGHRASSRLCPTDLRQRLSTRIRRSPRTDVPCSDFLDDGHGRLHVLAAADRPQCIGAGAVQLARRRRARLVPPVLRRRGNAGGCCGNRLASRPRRACSSSISYS